MIVVKVKFVAARRITNAAAAMNEMMFETLDDCLGEATVTCIVRVNAETGMRIVPLAGR